MTLSSFRNKSYSFRMNFKKLSFILLAISINDRVNNKTNIYICIHLLQKVQHYELTYVAKVSLAASNLISSVFTSNNWQYDQL